MIDVNELFTPEVFFRSKVKSISHEERLRFLQRVRSMKSDVVECHESGEVYRHPIWSVEVDVAGNHCHVVHTEAICLITEQGEDEEYLLYNRRCEAMKEMVARISVVFFSEAVRQSCCEYGCATEEPEYEVASELLQSLATPVISICDFDLDGFGNSPLDRSQDSEI